MIRIGTELKCSSIIYIVVRRLLTYIIIYRSGRNLRKGMRIQTQINLYIYIYTKCRIVRTSHKSDFTGLPGHPCKRARCSVKGFWYRGVPRTCRRNLSFDPVGPACLHLSLSHCSSEETPSARHRIYMYTNIRHWSRELLIIMRPQCAGDRKFAYLRPVSAINRQLV